MPCAFSRQPSTLNSVVPLDRIASAWVTKSVWLAQVS
jgi:hypothetical protein